MPALTLRGDVDVQKVVVAPVLNRRHAVDETQLFPGPRAQVDHDVAQVELRDVKKGLVQGVRVDAGAALHGDIAEQPAARVGLCELEF